MGLVLAAFIGWKSMPGAMIHVASSPLGLEETVEQIRVNAEAEGWVVSSVVKMEQSIAKHGGSIDKPVRLINLCQANYASRILNDPASRRVSVMMPCTMAVFEDDDGEIRVATMNTGLMGKMFGGTVAEVLGDSVTADASRMLAFLKGS